MSVAKKIVHVAAAVIVDDHGRILLAKRPDDKHQGGLWEFPGGKVESGEPVSSALLRELDEELGITVMASFPLIKVPYHYPDKSVLLDVYKVTAFTGEAYGREGQQVRWVEPADLDDYQFPAANRPIVNAALLPQRLLITGTAEPQEYVEKVAQAVNRGAEGVMFRANALDDASFAELAAVLQTGFTQARFLTLNCSIEMAEKLRADALHLNRHRLQELQDRKQFSGRWLSASCHSREELQMAVEKGVDFILLSPVKETSSHPGDAGMGWDRFADLLAECPVPVFALGGMGEEDLALASNAGAQGIAAISAWWA
ncbi:Nudix family hydrolase [Marinobacterium jannaschii]